MTTSDSQIPFRGPVTRLALDREAFSMIRSVAVDTLGFGRVPGPLRALAPVTGGPDDDTPRCGLQHRRDRAGSLGPTHPKPGAHLNPALERVAGLAPARAAAGGSC